MSLKDKFGSIGLFAVRDNDEIINLAEHFLELNSDAGAILTTTALGAGASYTQTGQDRLNRSPVVNRVKGEVWADQAGTLYLEESENNSTWTATRTVAVSAGVTAQVPWTILTKRYFRFRYVNGATAQTGFILVQQTGGPGMRNTVLTGSTVPESQAVYTRGKTIVETVSSPTVITAGAVVAIFNQVDCKDCSHVAFAGRETSNAAHPWSIFVMQHPQTGTVYNFQTPEDQFSAYMGGTAKREVLYGKISGQYKNRDTADHTYVGYMYKHYR